MTTILKTSPILFLLLALFATTTVMTPARQRYITLAANSEVDEISIYITDALDEMPTNDCGNDIKIRLLKHLGNDNFDPCNLATMSRLEFVRRVINDYMRQSGRKIDFPNGIDTETYKLLTRAPWFVDSARRVLDEFADAHGFGSLPVFLDHFPFDAFMK